MTVRKSNARTKSNLYESGKRYVGIFTVMLSATMLIAFSGEISTSIVSAIRLSVTSVIPALFPFIILSDFIISQPRGTGGMLGKGFSRAFGLPASAMTAFLCGTLCGFPIGVKVATEIYARGEISKDELERLIGFINNPSPAFVISAVGAMRGNISEGVILYIAVVLSAVIVGLTFSVHSRVIRKSAAPTKDREFNLVSSVKGAAYSSIGISAYIIFFSALLGIVRALWESEAVTVAFAVFLEIGNASSLIAGASLENTVSLALTGFALGFSGFSVHMQAFSLLPEEISRKKYILMKLMQGALAAAIAFFMTRIV